jgi:hypothetical protein
MSDSCANRHYDENLIRLSALIITTYFDCINNGIEGWSHFTLNS